MHLRPIRATLAVAVVLASAGAADPRVTLGGEARASVTAFLDGRAIPLVDVGRYYCDDLSFPVITCSVNAAWINARAVASLSASLSAAAVTYVTIYDAPTFGGAFMNVSQDYTGLSFIGWNDRISSFKARNAETGRFWTDWFYSGTTWSFCCNQQLASLGGYDNTFSAVERT